MATGVSKTQWQQEIDPAAGGGSGGFDVTLTYPGKQPATEILAIAPAEVRPMWPPTASAVACSTNRLYYGDNLAILAALRQDRAVCGQVRLIYIDPPFATNGVFQSRQQADAYQDVRIGAAYLEFLRARLILLHDLLAPDGSIYVHLDENMAFHVKVLLDELFGRTNYRNWITRKKCNPKNYTRNVYGNIADYILFYTKSDSYVWNRPMEPWTAERAAQEYSYVEAQTGRRYKKVPVHAPGIRNGATGQPWRGKRPPPGKHWQFPPATLDAMDERGEIYWSPTGNPRRKIYLDQSAGVPIQDIWLDVRDAHNQNIAITGYPTEKNPALLQRIIAASSNPGDFILDAFAGSGTALVSAAHLGRRWIGIDNSTEAIRTILHHFTHGPQRMGDFVTPTPPPSVSAEDSRPRQGVFPLLTAPATHTVDEPITPLDQGFSLYVDQHYGGELAETLDQWREQRIA